MKRKKVSVFLLLSSVSLIGFICIFNSLKVIDRISSENTSMCEAVIKDIEIIENDNMYVKIYTEEYSNYFLISNNICSNQNILSSICSVGKGETVYFNIENSKKEYLNVGSFIDIVSLETEDKVVFSINDYNACVNNSAFSPRIVCVLFIIVSAIVLLTCIVNLVRKRNIDDGLKPLQYSE